MTEYMVKSPSSLAVSVFPGGATRPDEVEHGTVGGVVAAIQSERLRAVTRYLRECLANDDLKSYAEAKRNLPVILWSGTFSRRAADGLIRYNGLVIGDVDHREDAVLIRDSLAGDPHIAACFVSPSGNGLKILMVTDASDPKDHGAAWATCAAYLALKGLELDPSGKDVPRACFACHDDGAWINDAAAPIAVDRSLFLSTTVPKKEGHGSQDGQRIAKDRHGYLVAYTARLAGLGLGETEITAAAHALIRDRFDLSDGRTFPDDEIHRAVAGAVRKFRGEDRVAAIAHGAEAQASLVAAYEARQPAVPAGSPIADPGPLPAELLSLPGLGGAWIAHCLARAPIPQPELALGAVLAACGALIGPRLAAGTARANLYCFGLADTGHGKNAAREGVMQVLAAAEAGGVLGNENIKSDAGLVSELVSKRNRVFLLDEAGYLLAAASARGAAAHLSGIPQVLLQLYSSSHLTWRGGAYADPEKNPVIQCPHACLYATSTPGKLWDSMTRDSLDGGLLGRCLFFFGEQAKPRRRRPAGADLTPPADLVDAVRAWAAGAGGFLAEQNGDAVQVTVEAEAEAHFIAALDELDDLERGPLKGNPTRAVFTRVVQQGERLALIRSWCRHQDAPVITVEDARWGTGLALHCARRLAFYAGDRIKGDDNPWENAYRRVLAAVRDAGGSLTRQQLYRAVRLPAHLLTSICDQAVEAGELVQGETPADRAESATAGGMPKLTYRIPA